jgi:threonine synthase
MGEGWTPLVSGEYDGLAVCWKLEYLNPTGSYKDRGIGPLMSVLQSYGVRSIVEDSSGNAGASVAAYAARAGIRATIFVPAHASPAKKAQISVYGAQIVPVVGPRSEATRLAEAALCDDVAYASHVWQPPVMVGLQTIAWEIWEQMGRQVPDWVVMPVGQGTLFLGAYRGFRILKESGLSDKVPRMVAVQATRCAPLHAAWARGSKHVHSVQPQGTAAEGIRIVKPVRGRELLEAIAESCGSVVVVEEEQILTAQAALAQAGFYVEPTSAVAAAALSQLREQVGSAETVVIPLTGSGLKGGPTDQ